MNDGNNDIYPIKAANQQVVVLQMSNLKIPTQYADLKKIERNQKNIECNENNSNVDKEKQNLNNIVNEKNIKRELEKLRKENEKLKQEIYNKNEQLKVVTKKKPRIGN